MTKKEEEKNEEKKNEKKAPEKRKNTITIDGEEYPIRCTLEVLSKIQEEAGLTPFDFSEKLIRVYSNTGSPADLLPDAKTLFLALPLFVNEGIDYYNDTHTIGKIENLTASYISRHCDDKISDVAHILFDEFWGSMRAPKQQPPAETTQK